MTSVALETGANALPARATRGRAPLSAIVLTVGCTAMFTALVLVIAGVPARIGYDVDGPPNRNVNHSHDMLKMSQSIDGNMKYIKQRTGHGEDEYNGLQTSINGSEDAIEPLSSGVANLTTAVKSIDSRMTSVQSTTRSMTGDMEEMATISAQSADTMDALGSNVDSIASSMGQLSTATRSLTDSMGGIERAAKKIADTHTSKALAITRDLNHVMPASVPAPQTTFAPDGGIG